MSLDQLSSIKAFAEIYGMTVYRGVGYHAHEYQLLKEVDGRSFPVCRYMEPAMLIAWIDGYEEGRKEQTPIIPKRGRRKQSSD